MGRLVAACFTFIVAAPVETTVLPDSQIKHKRKFTTKYISFMQCFEIISPPYQTLQKSSLKKANSSNVAYNLVLSKYLWNSCQMKLDSKTGAAWSFQLYVKILPHCWITWKCSSSSCHPQFKNFWYTTSEHGVV